MVKPPQHQRLATKPLLVAKREPIQYQRATDLLLTSQRVVNPPQHQPQRLVTKPLLAAKRKPIQHQR